MNYQPIPVSAGRKVIKNKPVPAHLDFGLDDDIDTNPKPNQISDIEQIFDKSNGFVPVGSLYKFRCKKVIADIAARKGFKPYPVDAVNVKYYAKDGCAIKDDSAVRQYRTANSCVKQMLEVLYMYGYADICVFAARFKQDYITKSIWMCIKVLESEGYKVVKIKGDQRKVLRLELIRPNQSLS